MIDDTAKETKPADDRVTIRITDFCVGSGTCALGHPDLFEMSESLAKPLVKSVIVSDDLWDAVWGCPVGAIELNSEITGQLLEQ